eukprot:SAG11_NODE_520_length_8780_cov_13.076719_3_plen_401_part_00
MAAAEPEAEPQAETDDALPYAARLEMCLNPKRNPPDISDDAYAARLEMCLNLNPPDINLFITLIEERYDGTPVFRFNEELAAACNLASGGNNVNNWKRDVPIPKKHWHRIRQFMSDYERNLREDPEGPDIIMFKTLMEERYDGTPVLGFNEALTAKFNQSANNVWNWTQNGLPKKHWDRIRKFMIDYERNLSEGWRPNPSVYSGSGRHKDPRATLVQIHDDSNFNGKVAVVLDKNDESYTVQIPNEVQELSLRREQGKVIYPVDVNLYLTIGRKNDKTLVDRLAKNLGYTSEKSFRDGLRVRDMILEKHAFKIAEFINSEPWVFTVFTVTAEGGAAEGGAAEGGGAGPVKVTRRVLTPRKTRRFIFMSDNTVTIEHIAEPEPEPAPAPEPTAELSPEPES